MAHGGLNLPLEDWQGCERGGFADRGGNALDNSTDADVALLLGR